MRYNIFAPLNTISKADIKDALEYAKAVIQLNNMSIGTIAKTCANANCYVVCADGLAVEIHANDTDESLL